MFSYVKRKNLENFLKSKKADQIKHVKHATLYEHLKRVGQLLTAWGLGEEVIDAGMCHSLYSTQAFQTQILDQRNRPELRALIGNNAEELVYFFCIMRRNSFRARDTGVYEFTTHRDEEQVPVSKEQARGLIHILLANDIDHLTDLNVYQVGGHIARYYAPWRELLCEKARNIVDAYALPSGMQPSTDDYVRFIGHAGVHVQTKRLSLVIDPWLYPSTREKPRLQGFEPGHFTIDFLIPEPRNTLEEINPDIILLSHFHTHHAPLEEIRECATRKSITLVCPPITEVRLEQIRASLGGAVFSKIQFKFIQEDTTFTLGDVTIRAHYHNREGHLAYVVTTERGTIFHLSDPVASITQSLNFDSVWDKFDNIQPDYAFISCAGHAQRRVHDDGTRTIHENETFTPTQAAKFALKIGAKAAGAVGIFNHSVWTNRVEFSRSSAEAESEFHWALSFLSPRTRVLTLRPGDVYPLNTGT